MSVSTDMEISSIHKSILEWSEGRPSWQRDALRLLVENDDLDESDIDGLVAICQSEHDLLEDEEESPSAEPLSRDHLPAVAAAGQAIALESVSDVKHVNALPDNQTLTFGETGLTIVYGDNGSGKTGYSRILKRACRARNQGDKIRPNVYKKAPSESARANIGYRSGDTSHTIEWIDGHETPLELSAISFFDSHCAVVHVEETNDIAFTPFGLDLLERLAEVCGRVKAKLDELKRQTESDRPRSILNPKCQRQTQVGKALASLTRNTNFEKLAALATLDKTEQKRVQQIKQDLAADPVKMAASVKGRRTRLESLLSAIAAVTEALSESRVETLRNLDEECRAKKKAAEVASTSLFADEPLPNVGSDAWRSLWEAARRYSDQEAYADEEFPFVDKGAKCVLCQQELQGDARRRLRSFEEFVKDEAAATAQEAREKLQQAKRQIEDAGLRTSVYKPVVEELAIDNKAVAASVHRAVVGLRLRRRAILKALETTDFDTVGSISDFPSDNCKRIIQDLKDREEQLSKSADPEKREELQSELQELEDRVWLSTILDDVEHEIWRLGHVHKLKNAIKSTLTTDITRKNKALAEEHVTNRLRDRFEEEIQRLHINKVRVELQQASGKRGASRYRICFLAAPNVKIGGVLSEGEHRSVALAGFLTELATAPSNSSLVFDDPISSLDHKWRRRVAIRLLAEAKDRQVIVFTHDIVFLHDLLDNSSEAGIKTHVQRVYRGSDGPGTVGDNLPWKAQNTIDRLDKLEKKARAAKALDEQGDEDGYEKSAINVYDELRATVERAIEEVLFSRVLFRHRDYIDLKNLRKVAIVEPNDCDLLLKLFGKCCDVTKAHDPSMARNAPAPPPTELLSDIKELSDWVRQFKDRQKDVA